MNDDAAARSVGDNPDELKEMEVAERGERGERGRRSGATLSQRIMQLKRKH